MPGNAGTGGPSFISDIFRMKIKTARRASHPRPREVKGKAGPRGGRRGSARWNWPSRCPDARGAESSPRHEGSEGRPQFCGFHASRRPLSLGAFSGTCPSLSPAPSLHPSWLEGGQDGRMQWEKAGSCFPPLFLAGITW